MGIAAAAIAIILVSWFAAALSLVLNSRPRSAEETARPRSVSVFGIFPLTPLIAIVLMAVVNNFIGAAGIYVFLGLHLILLLCYLVSIVSGEIGYRKLLREDKILAASIKRAEKRKNIK